MTKQIFQRERERRIEHDETNIPERERERMYNMLSRHLSSNM